MVAPVYSQANMGASGSKVDLGNSQNLRNFGFSFRNSHDLRTTNGTYYLFDEWENSGIVHTIDNGKFSIKNINLNLERHSFESKIDGDSLFTFNFNNIDRFIINGRTFKNFYWNDDNQVYEIVYENDGLQILKGFRVLYVPASVDPMVARTKDKFVRTEVFFLRQNEKLSPFKLKKSRILKLFNDDEDRLKVSAYADQQNLSFKREEDIQKIFDYSDRNNINVGKGVN